METIYKIKCIGGFRDGNAWPKPIPNGTVLEVSEKQYHRLIQSDPGAFEVMETVKKVPPSTKAKPKPQKEAGKAKSDGNEG